MKQEQSGQRNEIGIPSTSSSTLLLRRQYIYMPVQHFSIKVILLRLEMLTKLPRTSCCAKGPRFPLSIPIGGFISV